MRRKINNTLSLCHGIYFSRIFGYIVLHSFNYMKKKRRNIISTHLFLYLIDPAGYVSVVILPQQKYIIFDFYLVIVKNVHTGRILPPFWGRSQLRILSRDWGQQPWWQWCNWGWICQDWSLPSCNSCGGSGTGFCGKHQGLEGGLKYEGTLWESHVHGWFLYHYSKSIDQFRMSLSRSVANKQFS